LASYASPTAASQARSSAVAAAGSMRSLAHFGSLRRGSGAAAAFGGGGRQQMTMMPVTKSRSYANLSAAGKRHAFV